MWSVPGSEVTLTHSVSWLVSFPTPILVWFHPLSPKGLRMWPPWESGPSRRSKQAASGPMATPPLPQTKSRHGLSPLNPFSLGLSCSSQKTCWLIQDSARDNTGPSRVCIRFHCWEPEQRAQTPPPPAVLSGPVAEPCGRSIWPAPLSPWTEAGVGPQLTRVVGAEACSGGPQVPLVPWGSSL